MKLESSPIGDRDTRMMQIHSQLANLMVQLHHIKRGKEFQEEIWYTICRTYGHHKYNCSVLMNYVIAGVLDLLNTQGMPWCRIFHTRSHNSKECMYLQNILSAPTSMYCKFCKSVGHDENDCIEIQFL